MGNRKKRLLTTYADKQNSAVRKVTACFNQEIIQIAAVTTGDEYQTFHLSLVQGEDPLMFSVSSSPLYGHMMIKPVKQFQTSLKSFIRVKRMLHGSFFRLLCVY